MEVQRAVRQVEQRRRHDLPVVGEHRERRLEVQHRRDGDRIAQPLGRQDRCQAKRGGGVGDGRRPEGPGPAGRAWRRGDDADDGDSAVAGERVQGRDGEGAAAQEDGPDRGPGHARALVASRTSASSSFPSPTARSSSIDSR